MKGKHRGISLIGVKIMEVEDDAQIFYSSIRNFTTPSSYIRDVLSTRKRVILVVISIIVCKQQ
jgi:hypothetical protein